VEIGQKTRSQKPEVRGGIWPPRENKYEGIAFLLDLTAGGAMRKWNLYNVAKRYVEIIEQMERTRDAQRLTDLEEQRVIWHNRLLRILKREGIRYRDRDHVTQLAFHLVKTYDTGSDR
jgi:hypothetical protein